MTEYVQWEPVACSKCKRFVPVYQVRYAIREVTCRRCIKESGEEWIVWKLAE